MEIAQRTISASHKHISVDRKPRKAVPTTPKTLGDYILLKRYEKRLDMRKISSQLGISPSLLCAWENDLCEPAPEHLKALTDLYGLPA